MASFKRKVIDPDANAGGMERAYPKEMNADYYTLVNKFPPDPTEPIWKGYPPNGSREKAGKDFKRVYDKWYAKRKAEWELNDPLRSSQSRVPWYFPTDLDMTSSDYPNHIAYLQRPGPPLPYYEYRDNQGKRQFNDNFKEEYDAWYQYHVDEDDNGVMYDVGDPNFITEFRKRVTRMIDDENKQVPNNVLAILFNDGGGYGAFTNEEALNLSHALAFGSIEEAITYLKEGRAGPVDGRMELFLVCRHGGMQYRWMDNLPHNDGGDEASDMED